MGTVVSNTRHDHSTGFCLSMDWMRKLCEVVLLKNTSRFDSTACCVNLLETNYY